MAAANESHGLKIAVAVFVTLSVLLAVTTYFGFSNYSDATARLSKAESERSAATAAESAAKDLTEALRKEAGLRNQDADTIKNEIKEEYSKIDNDLTALIGEVSKAVDQAQARGAQGPDLEEAKTRVQKVASDFQTAPDRTLILSLDQMTDLLKNLSLLTTQLSINYTDVKRGLEGATGDADQRVAVVEKQYADTKQDLAKEQSDHVEERQSLLTKVDSLSTERARLEIEVANLNQKIRQLDDESSRKLELAQQTIREQRDQLDRTATVLDRPDGYVTFVDHGRGEAHVNVTRGQGARPQMVLSIFDAKSPGVPTAKPKGTIELVDVNDRFSIARIVKTNDSIAPIREGDIVYSAAWSPNEPMRFALIGKIDMNRDGADDRQDLKRMIEAAGGLVDFDLPPPEVGRPFGKLTGKDAWYVVDDREPFVEVYKPDTVTASESAEFLKQQSEVIREARLNGVRPMPIERLLPYLGYDYTAPVIGRAEAVDLKAIKRVLSPKQDAAP